MWILLLGGTGVIGRNLINYYNENGINVFVTSRSKHNDFGSIHFVHGNAMDDAFLHNVCMIRNWDAIVDFMSYNTDSFIARVNLLLSSTKQYVFISSARVYGNEEHPIKESSPRLLDSSKDYEFLATDEYSLTKARQEDILKNSGKNNFTIVRPCITYGVERLQLGVLEKEEWLFRAMNGKTVLMPIEILNRITTMTNGYDTCKFLAAIIGNERSIGSTIHVTNNYLLTWNDIWKIYDEAYYEIKGVHFKLKIVSLKDFLYTRMPNLKYQVIYDRVFDRDYDVSEQNKFLDTSSYIAPTDGLKNCLKDFILSHKSFKDINSVFEARKDKIAKEFTPLSAFVGKKAKLNYILERFFK